MYKRRPCSQGTLKPPLQPHPIPKTPNLVNSSPETRQTHIPQKRISGPARNRRWVARKNARLSGNRESHRETGQHTRHPLPRYVCTPAATENYGDFIDDRTPYFAWGLRRNFVVH